jgi:hypothetical protein
VHTLTKNWIATGISGFQFCRLSLVLLTPIKANHFMIVYPELRNNRQWSQRYIPTPTPMVIIKLSFNPNQKLEFDSHAKLKKFEPESTK